MRVAVIGAGPSGLVTLRYLLNAHTSLDSEPVDARLFETEAGVGGTFLARTYEDAELVSSKQLTAFSDFRLSDQDSDFMGAKQYIQYLHDYCTHFGLWSNINLATTVTTVVRQSGGAHLVTYHKKATGEIFSWECDAIAVCSGLHVAPSSPKIAGMDRVPLVMHSSEFKKREQFGVDKTVVILGSGETGADVSYLAITSPTKRVVMCHRNGFHFAPKRNLNPILLPILGNKPNNNLAVPLDNSRASLFDTAYVHPWLRNHTSLWVFYDAYVRFVLWSTTGTTAGLDQWVGEVSEERNHVSKMFFNKSNNAGPYISAPYRSAGQAAPLQRIRAALIQTPIKDTGGRQIDLAPWPSHVDERGAMHFHNNNRPEYTRMKNESIRPDIVVFCTGYRQEFSFFKANDDTEKPSKPYPSASVADVRSIWARNDPTVGFIGFVRPSLGAIPPLSEMQAQLWIVNLLTPERISRPLMPADEPHYRLLTAQNSRIKYGVDHESYVYQLALDMDSALGFCEVIAMGWRTGQWRLPLVWALGANLNTKFRLRGPWKWDGAEEVLVTEVWHVICRRRWFYDHFLLSVLPMMIFGPISLFVYLYATIWEAVGGKAIHGTHSPSVV